MAGISIVKTALSILRRILVLLMAAFVAVMIFFTIVSTFVLEKEDKNILGFKMFTVLTDSMSDTFNAGDVIICKEIDPSSLQPGDIITFRSTSSVSYGQIVTHKIRERVVTDKNQDAFITYGTTTDTDDESPVLYNKIIGKYQFKMAGAGKFFEFLKTPPGYIIFIFVPFITLILLQVVNTVKLYKKLKKERQSEADEEQSVLETTRRQTEALMEEIRILKEQVSKNLIATDLEEDGKNSK